MTTLLLHPTANDGAWGASGANIYVDDGVCALRILLGALVASTMFVSTYVDPAGNPPNIPVGSTLNFVKMHMHEHIYSGIVQPDPTDQYDMIHGMITMGVARAGSDVNNNCAACVITDGPDIAAILGLTINDINTENYTTYVKAVNGMMGGLAFWHYYDYVWIEVDYTPPSAVASRPLIGVGV